MKILIFSPFYPPHIGGLESHSDEFNKHLSARDISITVFTPQLPIDSLLEEIRHHQVRVIRFPAWEPIHNYPLPKYWPFWWNKYAFLLIRNLFRESPDIVISRTRFFSTSILAAFYAKLKGIPYVHIEHGSDFAQFNGTVKTSIGKFYDRTFGRLVLRAADRVIANSQASADFVQALSGRSDCHVIYRGVEIENIISIQPARRIESDEKVLITYVGRLIDGKGVIDLCQALTKLDTTTFHCYIIGHGPELNRLQTFCQKHALEKNVSFLGHQPFEQTIALLKTSDIIVNPSYTEGIPTSIIEAALTHKAIIATDVGGTREIIDGSGDGFLIPPRQPDILADKLRFLIEHPEQRQSLATAAFEKVHKKFSWDTAIDQYLSIFSDIIKDKK